jgi:hypothetical protein
MSRPKEEVHVNQTDYNKRRYARRMGTLEPFLVTTTLEEAIKNAGIQT